MKPKLKAKIKFELDKIEKEFEVKNNKIEQLIENMVKNEKS